MVGTKNQSKSKRCFNCGEVGYMSRECSHNGKKKCFKCDKFDHISMACANPNAKKDVKKNTKGIKDNKEKHEKE